MDVDATLPAPRGLDLSARRLAGLFLGAALALVPAEVGMRWYAPEAIGRAVDERVFPEDHPFNPQNGHVYLDDAIGYRPIPGGVLYGEHGARHNDYDLAKDPARRRVLFLGDSIAGRGILMDAFREVYGDEGYEWWNGGVTGYAAGQAVGYYRDRLTTIEADEVVLCFNFTDYRMTPLVTMDADGNVRMLNARRSGTSDWLLQNSHLYRWWVGRNLEAPKAVGVDPSVVERTKGELAELQELAAARGAGLSVVVTSAMRGLAEWTPDVVTDHEGTLAILGELGIPALDTRAALEATEAAGDPLAEPPLDLIHPSREYSLRIAADARAAGLLAPPQ